MDPNRPINEATEGDLKAEAAYKAYHKFITEAWTEVGKAGPGLILDIHGQGHGYNM